MQKNINTEMKFKSCRYLQYKILFFIFELLFIFSPCSVYSYETQPLNFNITPLKLHYTNETLNLTYDKPKKFEFITNLPFDFKKFWDETTRKSELPVLGAILISTGLLIHYDEPIIKEAQKLGRKWGISGDTANPVGFPFLELPSDLGSSLYFLGDGAVDICFVAGFYSYGAIYDNNRALQTSSQMTEGLLSVGAVIQILKHATGRTSPGQNHNKDKWRYLPNPVTYHKNVSHYDAYPSGHLASSMLVFTVITENYPEKKYIKPIGYTLMTMLSF